MGELSLLEVVSFLLRGVLRQTMILLSLGCAVDLFMDNDMCVAQSTLLAESMSLVFVVIPICIHSLFSFL